MTWNMIFQQLGEFYYLIARHMDSFSGKIAKGFLEWYVQNNGDMLPDTGRINMPSCICVKDLYKEYCDVYSEEETLERSQFYALWEREFKHVSFPKVFITTYKTQVLTKNVFFFSLIPWN